MESFWVATDIALVDNIRDNHCNIVLNQRYKSTLTSWTIMCRELESNEKDIQNKVASLLDCHGIESFRIIGLYVRPYSSDVPLTDTILLLLTHDGTIFQYNIEEAHLHRVCDVDHLEDIYVGIADNKRYNYQKKKFIDESNCLVDTTPFFAPYKAIIRPQIK